MNPTCGVVTMVSNCMGIEEMLIVKEMLIKDRQFCFANEREKSALSRATF